MDCIDYIKKYKQKILFVAVFLVTVISYVLFMKSHYFEILLNWSQHNELLFALLLLASVIAGLIYPPLPSRVLTLGAIPIIGWQGAFFIDFLGTLIGSVVTYYIGKRFGLKFLRWFFDKDSINDISTLRIVKGREIESVFVLCLIFNSTMIEVVSYGAGILKMSLTRFIIGRILSHLVVGIPSFYFISNVFQTRNIALNAVLLIFSLILFFKLKSRYFVRV